MEKSINLKALIDSSKIQRAAQMQCNEILFKNIARHIESRKETAKCILTVKDQEYLKDLNKVYELSEYYIKELLAL